MTLKVHYFDFRIGFVFTDVSPDETIESLEERAERSIADVPISDCITSDVPDPTSVTYIDYDNPFVS